MNLKHINWYGFKHEVAFKQFNVVKYLGDISVNGITYGLYFSENPDRSKGHQPYVLLTNKYVSGMKKSEVKKYTKITGILCLECDDVVYSPHVHGNIFCGCKENAIDGGEYYNRITGITNMLVEINLLTGKVKKYKVKK